MPLPPPPVRPDPNHVPTERELREDLAAAYRLIALFGMTDLVFTHLSARVPGQGHRFLVNPYGLLFELRDAHPHIGRHDGGRAAGSAAALESNEHGV